MLCRSGYDPLLDVLKYKHEEHSRAPLEWVKTRGINGKGKKMISQVKTRLNLWLNYVFITSAGPCCGPDSDLDPVANRVDDLVQFQVFSRLMSSFDTNFFSLDYSLTQSAAQCRLLVRMCPCAFVCVCDFVCDVTGVSHPTITSDWLCEGPSPPEFSLIPPG